MPLPITTKPLPITTKPLPITTKKIRIEQDEASRTWHNVFRVPSIEGGVVEVPLSREILSLRQVLAVLMKHGANLANSDASLKAIEDALEQNAPTYTRAARVGWRDGFEAFVLHRSVAGTDAKLLPPKLSLALGTRDLGTRDVPESIGTLAEWQRLISRCKYSTSMILGLCVVFATPLLRLLGRPNFAIVLFGSARLGKSTIQLVAGSVLGFRTEEMLPTFDATEAGLRALAISYNDHPLLLNEVASAKGKKSDVYQTLLGSTYALMSGRDTIRHPSWSDGCPTVNFSTIALLSSEWSPDVWAGRAGQVRDDGEKVRLIGVPVAFAPHVQTFDRAPSGYSPAHQQKTSKAFADGLKSGFKCRSGTAWPAFMDALVLNQAEIVAEAEAVIAQFERDMQPWREDPLQRDIVSKFAVLAAGGVVAITTKILPFKTDLIYDAVKQSCLAALGALPDQEGELRGDLATLRAKLEGPTILRAPTGTRPLSPGEQKLLEGADGIKFSRGTGTEFTIRSSSLSGWLPSPARLRQVLERLAQEGHLKQTRAGSSGRSIEWAQSQVEWYSGYRPRSIRISLPNGLNSLSNLAV
jgi:hypothetical protein